MNILKQSTAATIKLGPFVDDTDGKTAETALTIGQADIRLSKNGGDIAQSNNTAGATHDELGYYDIPLNTTDTDTLGRLRVLVSKAGALPVWQDFLIVTANVFDTLCSTGSLNVNAASLSTDAITAASVKADAVTKIQNGLATSAALDAVDNFVDTEVAAILAAVDTEITAIKAKTDNLPASPAAVGSAMTLTAAYDKAKDDVLTPLAVVDWIVDAIKAQTDKIPATPASSGEYTANIGAIKAKTDNLPLSPASSGEYTSALTAIQNDLDNPAQYKADVSGLALETTAQVIKTKTDQLTYTEGKVNANATIDASGLATEATLNAVKAKTDQLVFVNNKVDANATATVDTSGLALEITQQGILSMLSSDPLPVRIDGIVGSTITVTRGNDWMIPIEGLTLNGKIQLAIKRNDNQPDDRSALFVDSATGLITLNGKPATDPTLASLTYSGGILTLSVDASITAQLSAVSYRYGIQSVGGTVSEKYGGEFVVNADVVRATE